jgi:hypothetical protein
MKIAAFAPLFLAATVAASNPFAPSSSGNAKSKYMNKLMRGAKATENSQLGRKLDEEEEYIPDITQYSVKFQQCQFIKAYSDEMADQEDAGTVLLTQRFVIFRLCPSDSCGTCRNNYGEYMVDLNTYLEAVVEYESELQQEMCNTCEEYCQADDEEEQNDEERKLKKFTRKLEMDCDSCMDECDKIENMEDNGYMEATDFLNCEMIYDPEDDGTAAYYGGPICSSSGTKIKIGVFEDEDCTILDSGKNVDDYLGGEDAGMQLSHALLKKTYDADNCISCLVVEEEDENADEDEDNNDQDEDAEEEEPEVTEMCEALYEDAAKCEKQHGFDNGFADYAGYSNQLKQEELVCDFINSIQKGTYDELGEIKVKGKNSLGGGSTTGIQKFALTFFILGTAGLAAYAATLHMKITGGGKADLAASGGNMA